MAYMTEEEADALDEELTRTIPKVDFNKPDVFLYMKKNKTIFGLFAYTALFNLFFAGCATFGFHFNNVRISSHQNISSVLAGGTLAFGSTGRDVSWLVSSTPDGSGMVSQGTTISANGVLTVSPDEHLQNIYVIAISAYNGSSDFRRVRIVTVTDVAISPLNEVVAVGRMMQFSARVSGFNEPDNAVRWSVSSTYSGAGFVTSGTGIDSNGVLRVATNEHLRLLYITATSLVDPRFSEIIPVHVVVPIVTSIHIRSAAQSISAGRTLQFDALVAGAHNPSTNVTWRVSSNAAGTGAVTPGTTINRNGLLSVSSNESLTTLFVIATSVVNPSVSSSISVSVIVPTVSSVSVHPFNQTITAGHSFQFRANVIGEGSPNTNVTWSVSSNASGTGAVTPGTFINANGLLTVSPNETVRTLFVFATSVFEPSRSGSVSVSIIPAPPPPTPPTRPTPPSYGPPSGPPGAERPRPSPPAPPERPNPPGRPTPPPANPVVTGVTVNPSSFSTLTNRTIQFNAVVTGHNNPNTAVRWSVSGATASRTNITANGLLTVAPNEHAPTLIVTAASVENPSITASATVTITNNQQQGQRR